MLLKTYTAGLPDSFFLLKQVENHGFMQTFCIQDNINVKRGVKPGIFSAKIHLESKSGG